MSLKLYAKVFQFVVMLIAITHSVHAQECDIPNDKEYLKKLEKLENPNTAGEIRKNLLEDLLESYPNNPQLLYLLAKINFDEVEIGELNSDYSSAQKLFKQLISTCPDYDVSAYYYLGIIAYSKLKYSEAIKYFEEFTTFSSNARDNEHKQKLEDAKNSIPIIRQEALNNNNFDVLGADVKKPFILLNVSSPKDEYLPMLSPDNSLLYFSRKYFKQSKDDLISREIEEFTEAKRIDEDNLLYANGTAMQAPFNLGDNYGGVTLTANNKEMYITVCQPDSEGYKNCDIYHTYYTSIKNEKGVKKMAWQPLENLGPAINLPDGWESQPSISPDGQTLYFARYGFNTRQTDIYYSQKDSNGKWLSEYRWTR